MSAKTQYSRDQYTILSTVYPKYNAVLRGSCRTNFGKSVCVRAFPPVLKLIMADRIKEFLSPLLLRLTCMEGLKFSEQGVLWENTVLTHVTSDSKLKLWQRQLAVAIVADVWASCH